MTILIRKKSNNPPIDCDAVEERIRNGDKYISFQEHLALWQRDQAKERELISRGTAAAMHRPHLAALASRKFRARAIDL